LLELYPFDDFVHGALSDWRIEAVLYGRASSGAAGNTVPPAGANTGRIVACNTMK
jgi:hypothetical protein